MISINLGSKEETWSVWFTSKARLRSEEQRRGGRGQEGSQPLREEEFPVSSLFGSQVKLKLLEDHLPGIVWDSLNANRCRRRLP